jgi:hypothetical protein
MQPHGVSPPAPESICRGAGVSSDHAQRLDLVSAGYTGICLSGVLSSQRSGVCGVVGERPVGEREHSGRDWQPGFARRVRTRTGVLEMTGDGHTATRIRHLLVSARVRSVTVVAAGSAAWPTRQHSRQPPTPPRSWPGLRDPLVSSACPAGSLKVPCSPPGGSVCASPVTSRSSASMTRQEPTPSSSAQRHTEPVHLLPTELIVRASTGPPPGMT